MACVSHIVLFGSDQLLWAYRFLPRGHSLSQLRLSLCTRSSFVAEGSLSVQLRVSLSTCSTSSLTSFLSLPTMALLVPGSSSLILALLAPAVGGGVDKLDTRFAAIPTQNDVHPDQMEALGNAGVKSTALFGHIARNVEIFIKRVLTLDSSARPEDTIPIAKLTIVWETCLKLRGGDGGFGSSVGQPLATSAYRRRPLLCQGGFGEEGSQDAPRSQGAFGKLF